MRGTALKKVPAGYDPNHPQAEYLKMKSWYLEYPLSDEALSHTEELLSAAVRVFEQMKPFNDYLNQALAGFQMPQR